MYMHSFVAYMYSHCSLLCVVLQMFVHTRQMCITLWAGIYIYTIYTMYMYYYVCGPTKSKVFIIVIFWLAPHTSNHIHTSHVHHMYMHVYYIVHCTCTCISVSSEHWCSFYSYYTEPSLTSTLPTWKLTPSVYTCTCRSHTQVVQATYLLHVYYTCILIHIVYVYSTVN